MKRRSFLKTGLLGGVLLAALGGGGLALFPSRAVASPRRPLRVFGRPAFYVLVAVAGRVVVDPGADPVEIAHGVDELVSRIHPDAQREIQKLVGLFESGLAGLLFDGRPAPFTRLSPQDQDAALRAWRTSRLTVRRIGYGSLKKLCLLAHYQMPASWPAVDFPAPTPVGGPYDDSKMGTPEWLKANDLEAIP